MRKIFDESEASISIYETTPTMESRRLYSYRIPAPLRDRYKAVFDLAPDLVRPISIISAKLFCVNLKKGDVNSITDRKEFYVKLMLGNDLIDSCYVSLIRLSPRSLVVGFKNLTADQQELIARHFPLLLGQSLKLKELNTDSKLAPTVWYHGRNNTDLFLWSDDKGVLKFRKCSFIFEDSFVEWNEDGGLKTGRLTRGPSIRASDLFNRETSPADIDPEPNRDVLNYALNVIRSSSVEIGYKQFLEEIMEVNK